MTHDDSAVAAQLSALSRAYTRAASCVTRSFTYKHCLFFETTSYRNSLGLDRETELTWHRRTMQLAHHMSGLVLTPQCASGIEAFYHSARFVGWLAQLDAPHTWLGPDQKLDVDSIQPCSPCPHAQPAASRVQLNRECVRQSCRPCSGGCHR